MARELLVFVPSSSMSVARRAVARDGCLIGGEARVHDEPEPHGGDGVSLGDDELQPVAELGALEGRHPGLGRRARERDAPYDRHRPDPAASLANGWTSRT